VLDFDSLQDLLQNIATGDVSLDEIDTEGLPSEGLPLDQLSDALTSAGIDASQLSEDDLDRLISSLADTSGGTGASGHTLTFEGGESSTTGTSSTTDHTPSQTTEFPDGTKIDNPKTDALGYQYPDSRSYIDGVNKHVPIPSTDGGPNQATPAT
jgi:hypothetical protein